MAIVSQQIRTDKYGRKWPPSPFRSSAGRVRLISKLVFAESASISTIWWEFKWSFALEIRPRGKGKHQQLMAGRYGYSWTLQLDWLLGATGQPREVYQLMKDPIFPSSCQTIEQRKCILALVTVANLDDVTAVWAWIIGVLIYPNPLGLCRPDKWRQSTKSRGVYWCRSSHCLPFSCSRGTLNAARFLSNPRE